MIDEEWFYREEKISKKKCNLLAGSCTTVASDYALINILHRSRVTHISLKVIHIKVSFMITTDLFWAKLVWYAFNIEGAPLYN